MPKHLELRKLKKYNWLRSNSPGKLAVYSLQLAKKLVFQMGRVSTGRLCYQRGYPVSGDMWKKAMKYNKCIEFN